MRLLALFAVLLVGCSAAVVPAPETRSDAPPPVHEAWAFAGTLVQPGDPSLYNVVDAAVPLRDGGWLLLVENDSHRFLPCVACFGPLVKRPLATLIRVDATGVEVAREHGSEPFGLRELRLFEDLGLVIGIGPQVRNGSIHAFDLATLDGRWSELGSNCVPVADRCWTWRTFTSLGTTALVERDARTYRAITAYEHLRMDGLRESPGIYPALNTVVWQAPGFLSGHDLPRIAALDQSRPIAPWRAEVDGACSVDVIGATHLLLRHAAACWDESDPGTLSLLEVATGRTVKSWPADGSVFLDRVRLRDAGGALIDLRDGTASIDLPGKVLALDVVRGIAAVSLSNGGVAVYRRKPAGAASSSVRFTEVAKVACASLEFPLFALARDRDGRCPALDATAGPRRFLVTLGRVRATDDLMLNNITADPATRQLLVHAEPRGQLRNTVVDVGGASVIELPDSLHGQWLVRLDRGGAWNPASTFVIDLP